MTKKEIILELEKKINLQMDLLIKTPYEQTTQITLITQKLSNFRWLLEAIKNLTEETVKRENDSGIYCKSINNLCTDYDDCDSCIHPTPES